MDRRLGGGRGDCGGVPGLFVDGLGTDWDGCWREPEPVGRRFYYFCVRYCFFRYRGGHVAGGRVHVGGRVLGRAGARVIV